MAKPNFPAYSPYDTWQQKATGSLLICQFLLLMKNQRMTNKHLFQQFEMLTLDDLFSIAMKAVAVQVKPIDPGFSQFS